MSKRISDLEKRVAELEGRLELTALLLHQTAKVVNDNAEMVWRNFQLVCYANNTLATAIREIGGQVDEADWWRRGADDTQDGD